MNKPRPPPDGSQVFVTGYSAGMTRASTTPLWPTTPPPGPSDRRWWHGSEHRRQATVPPRWRSS